MSRGTRVGRRPVLASAIDVPSIAVVTERMKLVISAETECPPWLVGRPNATASVAPKARSLAAGAGAPSRGVVQPGEHLFEVPPQFQQLLRQLIQSRLG